MHQSNTNNRQYSIFNFQSQAGFTLIEIGIAIFILGIGLISMLTIFPIGVDSIKKVTQYSNAALLTESAISDLKSNDIVSIVGTLTAGQSYTYPDINNINQDRQFVDSYGTTTHAQYSWQTAVKNVTTDKNLIRAQIAIYRNFNSSQFGTGTATFTTSSASVSSISAFPSWLTSKHYIRATDDSSDKFWYRIDSIGTSTSTITLEGPFLGTGGAGLTFSTTKNIIDIYETMFSKR
ncbi:MAG: type II secretion system protein [Candidatus Brocadiales bacterium]|nr:type II secretion system protein [Candidatus Brocadiales bacterium]